MSNARRFALPVAAALLTGVIAAPAMAAAQHAGKTKPAHNKATSVLLKAAKTSVAPKHKTALTATLKSGKHRLAGEELWLEKRDAGTHKFGSPVDIGATDSDGKVTLPVVPGNHKGHKEQYRVVFQGDSGWKASHSAVVTVTVSAPTS